MKRLGFKLLLAAAMGMLLGHVHAQNTNNLCLNANPFCTDENPYGVSFPAGTDATATPDLPDAQRGCLYYTPAPAWYVMQIDNPGDLLIYMQHSGGRDIDPSAKLMAMTSSRVGMDHTTLMNHISTSSTHPRK